MLVREWQRDGKSVRKIVETRNLFTPAKMRMGGESIELFGFVDFRKESISFGGENSGAKRIVYTAFRNGNGPGAMSVHCKGTI